MQLDKCQVGSLAKNALAKNAGRAVFNVGFQPHDLVLTNRTELRHSR